MAPPRFYNPPPDPGMVRVKPGTRHQTILNASIMWVKHYIWRCKRGSVLPTLEGAKRVVLYESGHKNERKTSKMGISFYLRRGALI